MKKLRKKNFSYIGTPTPFVRAVMAVGGISEMARLLGTSRQLIWGWIHRRKPLPNLEECRKIEIKTEGLYTTRALRPDFFKDEK